MELVRVKSSPVQRGPTAPPRLNNLRPNQPTTTNSILRSLQHDNLLIKRKLREIETRLDRVSLDPLSSSSSPSRNKPNQSHLETYSTMSLHPQARDQLLESTSSIRMEAPPPPSSPDTLKKYEKLVQRQRRPKTAGTTHLTTHRPQVSIDLPESTGGGSTNLLDQIRERYIATNGGRLIVDSRPKRNISSASSSLNFDRIIDNLNRYVLTLLRT